MLGHHKWKGDLGIFNIVMIGLTNELSEKKEDYELHRMLGALLSMDMSVDERLEVLTSEYNMAVDDEMERSLINMCNLAAGVKEYGIKIGMEKGIETGKAEANKKTARRLYKLDHSVDEIADILEVSVDEVEDLLGLVKA